MIMNLQFFGGRGATLSIGSTKGKMNVPYDRWGKMISEDIRDDDGTIIGSIEDVERYVTEDYVEPTTKKAVLADIDAWRNDDGTYGDNDVAILLIMTENSLMLKILMARRTKRQELSVLQYPQAITKWCGGEKSTQKQAS